MMRLAHTRVLLEAREVGSEGVQKYLSPVLFSTLWSGGFSKGHVRIFSCSQGVTVKADLSFFSLVKMCYFYDPASLAGSLRSLTDVFHIQYCEMGRAVEWCGGKWVAHTHIRACLYVVMG